MQEEKTIFVQIFSVFFYFFSHRAKICKIFTIRSLI